MNKKMFWILVFAAAAGFPRAQAASFTVEEAHVSMSVLDRLFQKVESKVGGRTSMESFVRVQGLSVPLASKRKRPTAMVCVGFEKDHLVVGAVQRPLRRDLARQALRAGNWRALWGVFTAPLPDYVYQFRVDRRGRILPQVQYKVGFPFLASHHLKPDWSRASNLSTVRVITAALLKGLRLRLGAVAR